jgi:anti-sigma factor RsiW
MTCQGLVELVTDYLEGALAPAERARFEQHLRGCKGCRAYLAQMRHTIQTAGRLTEATLPAGAKEELLELFRGWKAEDSAEEGQRG